MFPGFLEQGMILATHESSYENVYLIYRYDPSSNNRCIVYKDQISDFVQLGFSVEDHWNEIPRYQGHKAVLGPIIIDRVPKEKFSHKEYEIHPLVKSFLQNNISNNQVKNLLRKE